MPDAAPPHHLCTCSYCLFLFLPAQHALPRSRACLSRTQRLTRSLPMWLRYCTKQASEYIVSLSPELAPPTPPQLSIHHDLLVWVGGGIACDKTSTLPLSLLFLPNQSILSAIPSLPDQAKPTASCLFWSIQLGRYTHRQRPRTPDALPLTNSALCLISYLRSSVFRNPLVQALLFKTIAK